MKQRCPRGLKKFLPLLQRFLRPQRVEFIRTVAHSNDARFPARASPGICWSIGINQHYTLSAFGEMPRRPSPEDPAPITATSNVPWLLTVSASYRNLHPN